MLDNRTIKQQTSHLLDICRQQKLMLATVESCTGGQFIAALTAIPHASDVVDCGFITYSNEAKSKLVGVPSEMILEYGAISKQVALRMAAGGLHHSRADIAIAITGVAGPDTAEQKPVGLVHIAIAGKHRPDFHQENYFSALDREHICQESVRLALNLLINYCIADNPILIGNA